MNYIKITKDNVNLAHEIEQQIFPEYDSLNNYLGHRMGILGCSTAEMKMSLSC